MLRARRSLVVLGLVGLIVPGCSPLAEVSASIASSTAGPERSTSQPTRSTGHTPGSSPVATESPRGSASTTRAPIPRPASPTPAPSPTGRARDPRSCGPGGIWIGYSTYGITCLDDAGWHSFRARSGPLGSDLTRALTTCPDGRTWIAAGFGLQVTDGERWGDMTSLLTAQQVPEALACDGGGLWIGHVGGIGRFDGRAVTWFDAVSLGVDPLEQVVDMAIGPAGDVWAVTASSVVRFDGVGWTTWDRADVDSSGRLFTALAIDRAGRAWVGHPDGVATFDGRQWLAVAGPSLFQILSLAVDPRNRIWAGTGNLGVSVWDGQRWTSYRRAEEGLSSNRVNAIAADSVGRMWLGTGWGLAVLDGETWRTYQMHNSELADNEVHLLAVQDAGPGLPAAQNKGPGSLTGRIVNDGAPVAGILLEACPEDPPTAFTDQTPCARQLASMTATTNADGRFVLDAMPVGRYWIALRTPSGGWHLVTERFASGTERAIVLESETTVLGELDLSDL